MRLSELRHLFQTSRRELPAILGAAALLSLAIGFWWWDAGDELVENRVMAGNVVRFSVPSGGKFNPGTKSAEVRLADGQLIGLRDDLTLFRNCRVGDQLDVRVRRMKNGDARFTYVPNTCHTPVLGVQPR